MASNPAHKFGQMIGEALEATIEPIIRQFASDHGLFFDKKGKRPARNGKKVCWTDIYGNVHDLDFVLEKGGTATEIGQPVAFIETAWRRYTKHSRNKAQEIQGAILPLVSTHHNAAPFIGVVAAGEWTDGALNQMKSLGFSVLYFPFDTVISSFQVVEIDAYYGEDTPRSEIEEKVRRWNDLPRERRLLVSDRLMYLNKIWIDSFIQSLLRAVNRQITSIHVIPLHGTRYELKSIGDAIDFIRSYNEAESIHRVMRYEIGIYYNNKDTISGNFSDKMEAIRFLQSYQPPDLRPA
jgi:hypothetical protein